MTLPYFKKNNEAAAVVMPVTDKVERKPDNESEDEFDSLSGAMSELHSALNAKDYKNAAKIFRSAFELMDSEPHVEGPHIKE